MRIAFITHVIAQQLREFMKGKKYEARNYSLLGQDAARSVGNLKTFERKALIKPCLVETSQSLAG
jgi:hypothetical protein